MKKKKAHRPKKAIYGEFLRTDKTLADKYSFERVLSTTHQNALNIVLPETTRNSMAIKCTQLEENQNKIKKMGVANNYCCASGI